MNFYDDLVMQTQRNYSNYYPINASGSTPYPLTDKKPLPYSEQIQRLVQEVKDADCVVVGGASGLSAAGGGDFYYEDNDSYRKYFRPFAEKYHFKGAFAGMMHPWKTREEYWGYASILRGTISFRRVLSGRVLPFIQPWPIQQVIAAKPVIYGR